MDVDILNPTSSDDPMDVMTMMMKMDNQKLPDLHEFYSLHDKNITPVIFPGPEFSTRTTTTINTTPPLISFQTPNHVPSSSIFITNPRPTIIDPVISSPAGHAISSASLSYDQKRNSIAAMREMIFRIAAMQPIHIDPESVKPPKRRNVKISKDPQSVAARHRRERISERIRILQRLVPGGTKMDTASTLDEAIHYVKFLKKQVQTLEQAGVGSRALGLGFNSGMNSSSSTMINCANVNCSSTLMKACQQAQMVGSSTVQMLR